MIYQIIYQIISRTDEITVLILIGHKHFLISTTTS